MMRYLADHQVLGLVGLWQKLCRGEMLIARCDKAWFFEVRVPRTDHASRTRGAAAGSQFGLRPTPTELTMLTTPRSFSCHLIRPSPPSVFVAALDAFTACLALRLSSLWFGPPIIRPFAE